MSRVIQPHRVHLSLVAAARHTANGENPLRELAAMHALTAALALLTEERDRLHPDNAERDDLSDAVAAIRTALASLGVER